MTSPPPHTQTRSSTLVTGGAGFLGERLVERLVSAGQHVAVVDSAEFESEPRVGPGTMQRLRGDARELADVLRAVDAPRFDTVVHLAGVVGVRRVLSEPERCRRENQGLARGLCAWLESLDESARPRVFAASTSEVYRAATRPLSERDPVHATDAGRRWAYAASKIGSERALDAAHSSTVQSQRVHSSEEDRAPVHLRFFNVVGPGQDSAQGMMLPTFVEQALAGQPITVHGDGSQVRTLAHVDDVAETLHALLVHPRLPGGPLNIGGTARASVLEIAECVRALSGTRAPIVHVDPLQTVGANFEDIAWREPDLTRLRALGVPVPARSLEEIVRDTLARHAALARRRRSCASRAS